LTRGQLERKIKKILSPYIILPEINVTITEFKSKVFYVLGEVGAPGRYLMRADNITVSEAVVMAGLPTVDAAMRKTRIITPSRNGPITRKVNLYNLLYFGDLKENLLINPGDYLYVPSTVLAKIIRIVSPVTTTIGLAAGPALEAGNAKQDLTPLAK
jgi:polysaccharide export outer membrane protein